VGDSVLLRLREVETVAFPSGQHAETRAAVPTAEAPARS
jgi:hypothetical protein